MDSRLNLDRDPPLQLDLTLDLDLDSRIFSPSIFRAPHLMAMGDTPPLSPMELPEPLALDSRSSSLIGLFSKSVGMRAMSSYGMLRRISTSGSGSGSGSTSGSGSGTGSGLVSDSSRSVSASGLGSTSESMSGFGCSSGSGSGSGSGLGSGSGSGPGSVMDSNSGSRSSMGSIGTFRIKDLNGSNPHSVSLTSMASRISQISLMDHDNNNDVNVNRNINIDNDNNTNANVSMNEMEIDPLYLGPGLRSALLHRTSVDLDNTSQRPSISMTSASAPRSSLPNVHFASPPPPTSKPTFTSNPHPSPTLKSVTFSPVLAPAPAPAPGLTSPRPYSPFGGSPRFAQSAFPPVSTPPSLLANPKSLGDPYPNGLSQKASQNLAGDGCACGCQYHARPRVKRRFSTRRINVITTPNPFAKDGRIDVQVASSNPDEVDVSPTDDRRCRR